MKDLEETKYSVLKIDPEDKIVVYLDCWDEEFRLTLKSYFGCREVLILPETSRIEVYK